MLNPALEYTVVHRGGSSLITELANTLDTHGKEGWKLVHYDETVLIFARTAETEEKNEAEKPES